MDGTVVDFDTKEGPPKRLPHRTQSRTQMGLKNDQTIMSGLDRSEDALGREEHAFKPLHTYYNMFET